MTLGEKIKSLRKNYNITQEELAEKLNVSRQAVTKWESDIGMPDVENLKNIATLFNITVDELLDYKKEILGDIILEEKYSLEGIKKEGKTRYKEEQYIVNKFNQSTAIYSLSRKKKWSGLKWLYYLFPGNSPEMEDFLENGINIFCLVEETEKQYIVIMNKDTIKVIQLKSLFSNKKLEINGYIYTKNYKIK